MRRMLVSLVIVLAGLAIRLGRLTFQPLWADEGYSVYFANLDALALPAATAADIHPPLYYYLLKLWMTAFGPSVFSLRLLSVFFGVAAVAATYALAERLFERRTAALAALLLALSPFHVYYSQEVRMYAMAALLAVLSTLALIGWMDEGRDPMRRLMAAVVYIGAGALLLYTLYYGVFVLAAQAVFVGLGCRCGRRIVLQWLIMQAVVLILYSPWLVGATSLLATYVAGKVSVEQYAALDPVSFLFKVLAAVGMGTPSTQRWFLALGAVPVLALTVVGLAMSGGATPGQPVVKQQECVARGRGGFLLGCLAMVPVVLGYGVNILWPFNPEGFQRLFLFCTPFLLTLAARGLLLGMQQVRWRGVVWLLMAVSAVFAAGTLADFYATPRHQRYDYRALVRDMSVLAHPSDVVIAFYPWQVGFVQTYFTGKLPHLVFVERRAEWASYPAVMQQDLARLGNEHGRIWFLSYEAAGGILENAVASYLTDTAYPVLTRWYGDNRLMLFCWGSVGPRQAHGYVVDRGLVLEGSRISLDPVEAGCGCLRIGLTWQATGSLPPEGQVALRLVDDGGRTWAQRDSIARNGTLPFGEWTPGSTVVDHHALVIPATVPPGSYRLLLAVFDRANARNLPIADGNGRAMGNEVEIAKVVTTRSAYRPPTQALGIPYPTSVRFIGAPRLIGYNVPAVVRPGHAVVMDLYWQTEDRITEDLTLFVQIRDRANKVWGLYEGTPVAAQYPPTLWNVGETLRGQIAFLLAPDAPAGMYRVAVGWLRGRSSQRVLVRGGGNEVIIGQVKAVTRPHIMTAPQPAIPMDERLGDIVQLLGFDGGTETVIAGEPVRLTLYWRALARMDISYLVFVHLVDGTGRIWAQCDSVPGKGEMPTTSWLAGEVVADGYELDVPPDMPPGIYTLLAGMYDGVTGARLSVRDPLTGSRGNAVELAHIRVVSP